MSEERKTPPHVDALRENVGELRRFARALVSPASGRTADALVQTAIARLSIPARATDDPLERAFGEIVRLNRRRVRERGRGLDAPESGTMGEDDRRDASISGRIAGMPLDEREALLIVGLVGLGYEAAARALDLPSSSVVSRLMRARARLDGATTGAGSRPGHLRVVK